MRRTHRALLLAAIVAALAMLASVGACSRKPVLEQLGRTGIEGIVRIGPSCPVQQAGTPCPDKPYVATVQVRDANGKVVTTFISGDDGTFQVDLPPGRYTLVPRTSGRLPHAEQRVVVVREGKRTHVEITYDSGIR